MCYNTLVSLEPTGRVVSTPGRGAAFFCHPNTDGSVKDMYFLLNETRLHPDDMENAVVVPFHSGMGSLRLTLRKLSTELRIGCRVVYSSGREFTSTTALMLLQGRV